MTRPLFLAMLGAATTLGAHAQTAEQGFVKGPVFAEYGPAAPVQSDLAMPENMTFKVAFDIAEAASGDEVSRPFESVARFINMHAASGVPRDRIQPAIVVHGAAAGDLLNAAEGAQPSATEGLIKALLDEGVPIYLCGQTAAAKGIDKDDLIPGIEMALSAMTAHAILAEKDYTLNPF